MIEIIKTTGGRMRIRANSISNVEEKLVYGKVVGIIISFLPKGQTESSIVVAKNKYDDFCDELDEIIRKEKEANSLFSFTKDVKGFNPDEAIQELSGGKR